MKVFGLLILAFFTTVLSVERYVCQIKDECSFIKGSLAQAAVPKPLLVKKNIDYIKIIKGRIHFRRGTKKISSSKKVQKYLRRIVKKWKANPIKVITITGHTDSKGKKKVNYRLGLSRGLTIKKALIHFGVSEKKIKVKSFGESKPISSNRTRKGRFYNRRVEINIK